MSDAVDRMLERFNTLYGAPQTDNPEMFIEEYRQLLKGYAEDVIDRTANLIIREQDKPFWPTPGKCRQVANKAAAELQYLRPHVQVFRDGTYKITHERRELPADVQAGIETQRRIASDFAATGKAIPLADVSRPAFEVVQQESPNGFHRLTSVSRRITGERDE